MKTIFITHAVKEEFIPIGAANSAIKHIYTGVGKTKSAHILTKNICQLKPDLVLNIGTAGTLKHQIGDIFISTHFIDRDYETIRLPGLEFEIDGQDLFHKNLPIKKWIDKYEKKGICNTGDSFVTNAEKINGDIIDMEAYTQAFVCKEFKIPFISVKYITDIIGQNSVELWESKLNDARNSLEKWFDENK
ncbi:hypothetical protein [Draconibacterium sediminis]|uniref:5'-methylthioadenosine/S-adenosylhomocysteine nucleosidase family protein n=1 Tax=Draconibacterium sediminis TaxID=1544798 RepID=UPI0026EB7033|nr:hypothetical protein [Draconibacterium sediminis]